MEGREGKGRVRFLGLQTEPLQTTAASPRTVPEAGAQHQAVSRAAPLQRLQGTVHLPPPAPLSVSLVRSACRSPPASPVYGHADGPGEPPALWSFNRLCKDHFPKPGQIYGFWGQDLTSGGHSCHVGRTANWGRTHGGRGTVRRDTRGRAATWAEGSEDSQGRGATLRTSAHRKPSRESPGARVSFQERQSPSPPLWGASRAGASGGGHTWWGREALLSCDGQVA